MRQHPRLILWHLAARNKLLPACQARYPESTTLTLDFTYIKAAVAAVREMRRDLLRLGFGPFHFWRQMTGGAHGVFALLPVCDSISLYGFTSWVRSDVYTSIQRDQYAGGVLITRIHLLSSLAPTEGFLFFFLKVESLQGATRWAEYV